MKLVNLTPHAITVIVNNNSACYPPSGVVARCAETVEHMGSIEFGDEQIPIIRKAFGAVEGLPEPEDGTMYIVSGLVKQAVPERADAVSPGNPVRDADGRIIGCGAFCI